MNERSHMKLKDIATEIGIPPSSLSQIFIKAGYTRKGGFYKKENKKLVEKQEVVNDTPEEIKELLKHKDELIRLVTNYKEEKPLDFTPIHKFKNDDGKIKWDTLTFQIPKELHNELNEYLERRGYKKQFLISLIIKNFLDNNK